MLSLLLSLSMGADPAPPVRVDLPPPAGGLVEIKVPVGRCTLTAADGKPAKWLLVDPGDADLFEWNGVAVCYTKKAGRYKAVMHQEGTGLTGVVLVAGEPPPGPPKPDEPPGPPLPPPPVPGDKLTAAVREAFAKSKELDKGDTRKNLLALFTVAVNQAKNPKLATTSALLSQVSSASEVMVGEGKLVEVRQIIMDDLAEQFPDDAPLDDAARRKFSELFLKYASALGE